MCKHSQARLKILIANLILLLRVGNLSLEQKRVGPDERLPKSISQFPGFACVRRGLVQLTTRGKPGREMHSSAGLCEAIIALPGLLKEREQIGVSLIRSLFEQGTAQEMVNFTPYIGKPEGKIRREPFIGIESSQPGRFFFSILPGQILIGRLQLLAGVSNPQLCQSLLKHPQRFLGLSLTTIREAETGIHLSEKKNILRYARLFQKSLTLPLQLNSLLRIAHSRVHAAL